MIAGRAAASLSTARSSHAFRGFVPRKGCRAESGIAPSASRNLNELCAWFVDSEKKDISLGHSRTGSPPKRVVIVIAIKVRPAFKNKLGPVGRPGRVPAVQFLFIRELAEIGAIRIHHENLRVQFLAHKKSNAFPIRRPYR